MALTRIKTNQITDLNVTTAKLANSSVTAGKLADNITYGSDFTVSGNLTVSGTTTSVSTTNTRVEDAVLALNAEATGSAAADAGILVNRGSDDNYAILWDESEDKFVFANVGAENGDTNGNITVGAAAPVTVGALETSTISASGTITGDVTGDLTGNADTATALETARAIALAGDVVGTANFDGTGDISITATIQADSVALGTDTTGDYTATITGGNGIASTGATSGEGIAHSLSVDLTDTAIFASDGTASRAVVLDASGDFTANAITSDLTGDVTGNADTATALETARAIALSGDVVGTVNFDGTAGVTISTTIQADSVALGTDTTGNYVSTITGGNGIASTGATSGETIAHSLSVDLTDANIFASDGTVSRAVVLDGSGNFTANAITTTNIDGIVGGNTPAAVTGTTITANTSATLASAAVSDLTSGRIVLAGTSGELEDSASLAFDGTTLEVNGAVTVSTTLDVTGTTSLDGAVNLGDASGDAIAILGTATFTPSADFDGGFTVAGSQTIDMGANAVTNVADPSSAQHAATKAYVDSSISNTGTLTLAADSGTNDGVVIGTDILTFAGTANEIETAVTNNQIQIGLPNDVTISGDAVVTGNLTVNGTTTTLSTTNSVVSDSLIELNSGVGSNANDLGLIFERGSTGDNAVFAWDESVDKFTLGTTTATGASTGDLTITSGTLVADLEGNADTATALETARAIALAGDVVGTVNFDGTGDVSITTTIQADSVALGTDTTGNYVQSLADAGNSQFTITNGAAEGGEATIALANNAVTMGTHTAGNYVATIADAGNGFFTVANSGSETAAVTLDLVSGSVTLGTHTSGDFVGTITGGNGIASTGATSGEDTDHSLSIDLTDTAIFASDGTVSKAVVLDASGDFSANMITADLTGDVTGNADTATALETARAIEVSGAVTGTANFDGTSAINIVTTATADPTITLAGDLSGSVTLTNLGDGTLTATIAANSVALGTDTTGNYMSGATGGNGIAVTHTPAEGSSAAIAVDLTDTAIFASDGTASRAVVLDASGDFTASTGTFTNIDGILGANTAAAASVTTLSATGLASLDGGIVVDTDKFTVSAAGDGIIETLVVGGGTLVAGSELTVNSTGSVMLAKGTTAQRPGSGATGMFRYNTTGNNLEYYDNVGWKSLSSDFTIASSQTFNGDDTTTAFTLTALAGTDSYTSAGVLVMLNGVVQEPTTVYGITGTTLTFTTAPATGDLIEVRKFTTSTTVVAISDIDGDTLIQVEEGSDDDTIRFDVQGVEKMYLNSTGLQLAGDLHATGTISSDGDITFGDSSTDTVTFTAKIGSDIIPTADSTFDLGSDPASSGFAWQNVYADTYYGDGSNLTGIDATAIQNGTSNVQVASNADITITRGGTLSATFTAAGMTGDVTGDVTGNADTATALETARTIGGVSFDGTSAINLPGVNTGGNQDTSGNAATATALETARAIEVSGAVTGTANFDGTSAINIVTTATADPTLTLAGDLSGSATFTNLGNATLTATIAANSVALGTDTTGNYVGTGATSGNGISGSVSSEGGTFTVSSNATSSNSGNTIVFRDGSGNFSAGVITGTSTAARYADLAEMYAADEAIEPGTVVHFAGDGKVAACDIANCRAVAGIISTDPAHLMNSDQEGVALALAGRVPCKVTGPVAAGDLMVSAGNGMAMANNEAAMGTVIGKAIEANEGGEGVIEVLALMM